jgi:hypothetical protein
MMQQDYCCHSRANYKCYLTIKKLCLNGVQLVKRVVVLVKHCHGKVSNVGRIAE